MPELTPTFRSPEEDYLAKLRFIIGVNRDKHEMPKHPEILAELDKLCRAINRLKFDNMKDSTFVMLNQHVSNFYRTAQEIETTIAHYESVLVAGAQPIPEANAEPLPISHAQPDSQDAPGESDDLAEESAENIVEQMKMLIVSIKKNQEFSEKINSLLINFFGDAKSDTYNYPGNIRFTQIRDEVRDSITAIYALQESVDAPMSSLGLKKAFHGIKMNANHYMKAMVEQNNRIIGIYKKILIFFNKAVETDNSPISSVSSNRSTQAFFSPTEAGSRRASFNLDKDSDIDSDLESSWSSCSSSTLST